MAPTDKWRCPECMLTFYTNLTRIRHLFSHIGDEATWTCQRCATSKPYEYIKEFHREKDHSCLRLGLAFTLEKREFNMRSIHRWAMENKVSKEVLEQELTKFQTAQSKVKPKPLVGKKRSHSTAGPSGCITGRRNPKRLKPDVIKLPALVNLKKCSVDLSGSRVKTRSSTKGKTGKGLRAKKSKLNETSPNLPSNETVESIEPIPVLEPKSSNTSNNNVVVIETSEITADLLAVVDPNSGELDESSKSVNTSTAEVKSIISVNRKVALEDSPEKVALLDQSTQEIDTVKPLIDNDSPGKNIEDSPEQVDLLDQSTQAIDSNETLMYNDSPDVNKMVDSPERVELFDQSTQELDTDEPIIAGNMTDVHNITCEMTVYSDDDQDWDKPADSTPKNVPLLSTIRRSGKHHPVSARTSSNSLNVLDQNQDNSVGTPPTIVSLIPNVHNTPIDPGECVVTTTTPAGKSTLLNSEDANYMMDTPAFDANETISSPQVAEDGTGNNNNQMPGGTTSDATGNETTANETASATNQNRSQTVSSHPPLNLTQLMSLNPRLRTD